MGEWIILSKKSYNKIWLRIGERLNTRDYGRVKLLFVHSQKFSGRKKNLKYVKYKIIKF